MLEDRAHRDVALHRQTWPLEPERLSRVTAAVREAGRRQLRATRQDKRTTASGRP
ncbi:hypothetical protein ACGRHY_03000 [Streptomyces sp. HK10]|uniref:hypothetical protein n=1 Tax=Streptomyces sp. HK10 TaxID=3373255 RepID=UPI00374A7572